MYESLLKKNMLCDIWANDKEKKGKNVMFPCIVAVLDICQVALYGRAVVMC